MTDEEALSAFWTAFFHTNQGCNTEDAYDAGFRAGLAHARRWMPLTSDPASWPEARGQTVLFADELTGRCAVRAWGGYATCGPWTHWMPFPLPPPPKGESK